MIDIVTMEKWKAIPEYEGLYEVSNLGRVKSLRRKVNLPNGGFRIDKEKIMAPKINRLIYPMVTLSKNGKVKTCKIHRLVMFAFVGISDLQVNHINFDKLDARLVNLEYVTRQENFNHSRERHLKAQLRGDRNPSTKIPDSEVNKIKKLRGKVSCTKLASKYGVHHSCISRIWLGRRSTTHEK